MTQNMNEVLSQATKKIASVIQKTMLRNNKGKANTGISADNLETLMRDWNFIIC